jgi:hypothetical protein
MVFNATFNNISVISFTVTLVFNHESMKWPDFNVIENYSKKGCPIFNL